MKKDLTIADIAKMANVSKATVSFVLNNKLGVSEQTRQKVLSIIEETNYSPTLNSRRLYYHKSFTIAVVYDKSVPVFDNLFSYSIMKALMKRCMHYDYALVYSEYSMDGDIPILPQSIVNRDVDGLVFLRDIPLTLISKLHELDIPFVVADDHSEHSSLYTVKADYALAAYTAVKYLLESGHKKVGFFGNMNLPAFYIQVFSGYQKALKEFGTSMKLDWLFNEVHNPDDVEACVCRMIAADDFPTAIFCMEDMLAITLIRCLQKHGLRVPEDVSVVAIDDIVLSSQIYPSLTTVSLDKNALGNCAVDLLIDLINGNDPQSITISSNNLIVRESVRVLDDG